MAVIPATAYVSEALFSRGVVFTALFIEPIGTPVNSDWEWHIMHPSGEIVVLYGVPVEQRPQAEVVVKALQLVPHESKDYWTIFTEVMTLTGAQLSSVYSDLSVGWPSKLVLDTSYLHPTLSLVDWLLKNGNPFSAYALDDLKRMVATLYVEAYRFYLVKPTFDASINISGYRPVGGAA